MKLEDIGFYTLSDERAERADHTTPLSRCELVLTSRCNFNCPYCRNIGGNDLELSKAKETVRIWADDGLNNIRFSGGEPTLYKGLDSLCNLSRSLGVERIAISTNGSASTVEYEKLIQSGANDFSVSLDACCSEDGDKMAGGVKGAFDRVTKNIEWLSSRVYVTVGVVLTDSNVESVSDIVEFADSLGVSDIRVIPAAQNGDKISGVHVASDLLGKYPILKYRIRNIQDGRSVRGLNCNDSGSCAIVLDDMAVNRGKHYPCIIYMRESGEPIGRVGKNMRRDRLAWYNSHNIKADPICSKNCLDVCVDYNNRHKEMRERDKEALFIV